MIKRLSASLGKLALKIYSQIMFDLDMVLHRPLINGPKIIVANHPTTSDPFILFAKTKGRVSIFIKEILFKIPLFGKYLSYIGHIPVQMGHGEEAFQRALKLLKRGTTIIVFIEGDLSPLVNQFLKPRTGAVRLALLSGAPLIPVGISVRGENVTPLDSKIKGITEHARWYFRGPYAITYGKSLRIFGSVEDRNRVRLLSEEIMGKIKKLTKESAKRIKTF